MARSNKDIINITLNITGTISLDWERIESDPIWRSILLLYEDTVDLYAPLCDYINHYLKQDHILTNCPSTNGPGDITLKGLKEIQNGETNKQECNY